MAENVTEMNAWGDDPRDVGDGFCAYCEREWPWHYDSCTPAGRTAAEAARGPAADVTGGLVWAPFYGDEDWV